MNVAIHETRSTGIRATTGLPVGTTCFWTWKQIEQTLRQNGDIHADEKLIGLVLEDRGVTLCLEKR